MAVDRATRLNTKEKLMEQHSEHDKPVEHDSEACFGRREIESLFSCAGKTGWARFWCRFWRWAVLKRGYSAAALDYVPEPAQQARSGGTAGEPPYRDQR